MRTYSPSIKDIKRAWHLVDAKEKILGRVSTQIAELLIGKKKPYFVSHLDCGDFVVVINAAHVAVTGKKEKQKTYFRHSGYPGGLKAVSLGELRSKQPEKIIIHAVSGMLPQNKLRDRMNDSYKKISKDNKKYNDDRDEYLDSDSETKDKKRTNNRKIEKTMSYLEHFNGFFHDIDSGILESDIIKNIVGHFFLFLPFFSDFLVKFGEKVVKNGQNLVKKW